MLVSRQTCGIPRASLFVLYAGRLRTWRLEHHRSVSDATFFSPAVPMP